MNTKQIGLLCMTEISDGFWIVTTHEAGVVFASIEVKDDEATLNLEHHKRWPCDKSAIPLWLMDSLTKAMAYVERVAAMDRLLDLSVTE